MIDPLSVWISTYQSLPKTRDTSWAGNIANWVYARITNNEMVGVTTAVPPLDFKKDIFEAQLLAMVPTLDKTVGISQFTNAWVTAINTSSVLLVSSGDYIGTPTPTNTWSTVTATLDTLSIAKGRSTLMKLVTDPMTNDPSSSQFPVRIREAFLDLTGSAIGLNSVPPPSGPQPLESVLTSII